MLLSTCRSRCIFALPLAGLALAAVLVLVAGGAQATLIDRGQGFIYDTLQDITWTRNANINGVHDWQTQMDWAAGYSQTHSVHGTFDDWRLPHTPQPDPTCSGSATASGSGCTGSEMGHLFNVDGISHSSMGLFTNVQSAFYWSENIYLGATPYALTFDASGIHAEPGFQTFNGPSAPSHAWAVRPGDIVPIPEPSSILLVTLGLAGLGMRRRIVRDHRKRFNP